MKRVDQFAIDVELHCTCAALPTRTGCAPSAGQPAGLPFQEAPLAMMPYMICMLAGDPATARNSQLCQAEASSV